MRSPIPWRAEEEYAGLSSSKTVAYYDIYDANGGFICTIEFEDEEHAKVIANLICEAVNNKAKEAKKLTDHELAMDAIARG